MAHHLLSLDQARKNLENQARGLGTAIAEALPSNIGFTLVLFDRSAKGHMAYLSNGQREDIVKMLEELVAKLKTEIS